MIEISWFIYLSAFFLGLLTSFFLLIMIGYLAISKKKDLIKMFDNGNK